MYIHNNKILVYYYDIVVDMSLCMCINTHLQIEVTITASSDYETLESKTNVSIRK